MPTTSVSRTGRWWPSVLVAAGVAFWPVEPGLGLADHQREWEERSAEAAEPVASVSLRVDLAERRLRVIEDGQVTRSYVVGVGKPGHRTPQGTFSIRRIEWNPSWVPPDRPWARGKQARGPGDPRNPMGRVKIFFREPTYFIHGTPDEGTLGQAVSHGCIRMRNADAIELAKLLMERGGSRQPESWFQRVLARATRTEVVRLSNPVTLAVRA